MSQSHTQTIMEILGNVGKPILSIIDSQKMLVKPIISMIFGKANEPEP